MPGIQHVLFIDESGSGGATAGRSTARTCESIWVTVGVLIPWDRLDEAEATLENVKVGCFKPGTREIKGRYVKRDLLPGVSEASALAQLAGIAPGVEGSVWVAACAPPCDPHARYPAAATDPRAIARHLLIDRVNGMAGSRPFDRSSWLIVCDLSNSADLAQFSSTVTGFTEAIANRPRSKVIHPELLGATSERWPAIQIADVFGFYARHALGAKLHIPRARWETTEMFIDHLYPSLKRSGSGSVVGWAPWPSGSVRAAAAAGQPDVPVIPADYGAFRKMRRL